MFDLDIKTPQEEPKLDYKKFIVSKEQINSKLLKYVRGEVPKGYGIGLPVLDDVIVCKVNELFACVGKKGRGKTTIQQILFLAWAMVNDLTFVMALQENEEALEKMNLLGYLFGKSASKVERENKELYNKGVKWLDNHIINLDVEDFKTALEVTEAMINDGIKVSGLFLDPVNSFANGWNEGGNKYEKDQLAGQKILKFSKNVCSVFLSQHPTITGQRQTEDVNSFSAEGGHFLNKSHFTWAINRDNGSSTNRVSVDNVRNTYTGGGVTHPDSPLLLHWSPHDIDIENNGTIEKNIIQRIRRKFNPLKEVFTVETEEPIKNVIQPATAEEAFGEDFGKNDKCPF